MRTGVATTAFAATAIAVAANAVPSGAGTATGLLPDKPTWWQKFEVGERRGARRLP